VTRAITILQDKLSEHRVSGLAPYLRISQSSKSLTMEEHVALNLQEQDKKKSESYSTMKSLTNAW
jgi:hypothetical protein